MTIIIGEKGAILIAFTTISGFVLILYIPP